MAQNTTNNQRKPSDLDKSIDLGMDQFGRFVRLRWLWLVIAGIILWYFIVNIAPQLSAPSPGSIFFFVFQLAFAVLFIVIQFVALFMFLGRARVYWVMPGETGVGFSDYKGNPEVLEAARRIVILMQGVKEFRDMGGQPVRGLLLSGPPGTGKSYLAQCMSTEAQIPFGYASASSFRAMFIGMDVLQIWRLYRKARRLAREYGGCVIFMDEIDAIGMSRSQRGGGTMAMGGGIFGGMGGTGGLNQLLMEMDPPNIETGWFRKILRTIGLYHSRVQNQPVLTVGATNVPDSLDPALLRPGRFDRRIRVDVPTDKYRGEVIEYYLEKVKHDSNISIPVLVQRLSEYSPVAIKHIVNEAVIIAHFDGRDQITYKDLIEAQDVHDYGLRQLSDLTPIERRRLAYHEAGHAVASYYLMERYFPAYVTLHRRDAVGGEAFAHGRPKESIKTNNREEVLADIQVDVASRAAEELFLDVRLNGVGGDFASATRQAARYVGQWGMDGTITSYAGLAGLDQAILQAAFAERVEAILQSQLKAVKQLFREHSEAVIAVAEALIERDELVADELKQIIDEADARRVTKVVIADFEPMLRNGNGHGNGHSDYAAAGSSGSSSTPLLDGPGRDAPQLPPSLIDPLNMSTTQSPPEPENPPFFMGG